MQPSLLPGMLRRSPSGRVTVSAIERHRVQASEACRVCFSTPSEKWCASDDFARRIGRTDIRVCLSGHSCPEDRVDKNVHTRQTRMSVLPNRPRFRKAAHAKSWEAHPTRLERDQTAQSCRSGNCIVAHAIALYEKAGIFFPTVTTRASVAGNGARPGQGAIKPSLRRYPARVG